MDSHPPKLDPTYFVWEKNEKQKILAPIGVPKTGGQPLTRSWKLSSATVHQRSHVPQKGAAVHLANYYVALCAHVVEIVGNDPITRPRLTRKEKLMMATQLF